MREIKCRGKDERGKWHYGYYVDGYMFDSMSGGMVTVPFIVQDQLNNPQRVVAETVGQYTGLKDKNCNEIYEGDIVSRHEGGMHFQEEPLAEHVVKWGNFGWSPFEIGEGKMRCVYGELYDFIVIGNVYENPELLEESK
ncbi:YopX family protein [Bacillus mycoides]|uniref:YopX family protein n=1 Tax=Bacillus mycoides TaxID=1405 RepID=UPI0011A0C13B|nr:YopX family protein [Bacillus mycoides]